MPPTYTPSEILFILIVSILPQQLSYKPKCDMPYCLRDVTVSDPEYYLQASQQQQRTISKISLVLKYF
jgi:hypothetical protein